MNSIGADLPFLRDASEIVATQTDRVITRANLLAEIGELAEQLPDRRYLINLCADRYRFAVALAAAMLRGQITLLPGGGDAGSVATLLVDYPELYLLNDDETRPLPGFCMSYPAFRALGTSDRVPAFPADQIAAVLFTSGSTGRPAASVRRWGRLVRGCLAAGAALGIERYRGAAVVATVPHAHSYGLESSVMLPLQHGLLLTADRPFFPADVVAALRSQNRPGILVTTPAHLRALVGDAAAGLAPGETSAAASLVLSATAPLPAELAGRAETAFSAPVFEIYGCSEAGQLATRRTTDGPAWRCLERFGLRQDAAGTWASGPNEDDVLLADEIELTGAGFVLLGRTADMVNVAGKRSSLAYLTRQLIAIDGVEDGVFLMPGEPSGASQRLTAVVVAPGLDAPTIMDALRGRIDAAFLPRPLRVVEALPRNVLGKLPRNELLRLFDMPEATVTLRFPLDHLAGVGHFPGNPIIPGAVLLDALVPALFPDGWSGEIDAVKFHRPIRPGDTVTVGHRSQGDTTRFECRLAGSDQLVLSGALRSKFPSR